MISPRIARVISAALVCGAILFSLMVVFGCATPEERLEGNEEMAMIRYEFSIFAYQCYTDGGHIIIDRPDFYKRRVQNAPVTVWEMKDAICKYDDEQYPVRLYYD